VREQELVAGVVRGFAGHGLDYPLSGSVRQALEYAGGYT
jgi:hypothetical protein